MDQLHLAQIVRRAIEGGAELAPPIPGTDSHSDLNYIRGQIDIGIEPVLLEGLLKQLQDIPEVAHLTACHASMTVGGSTSINLDTIARLLIARSIATQDVEGTVSTFCEYTKRNAAPALAVMAVSGLTVNKKVQLGPDVSLVPLSSIAPSIPRGAALGQQEFQYPMSSARVSAAFVMQFNFGPVFGLPSAKPSAAEQAWSKTKVVRHRLDEARILLGILGIYPTFRMFWVQPNDLLMVMGTSPAWQFGDGTSLEPEHEVPVEEAESLATAYFEVDEARRNKQLRIPLDRLNRAGRERDLADRSIDLGIALEALLLQDAGDARERGELRFRLCLRGAWLLGRTEEQRGTVQRVLKKIYEMRSQAVHSGDLENTQESWLMVEEATRTCRNLIRAVIERGCQCDWNRLVLGADLPRTERS